MSEKDEIGYVIERDINSELHYWAGKDVKDFRTGHADAIRFSRFQDGTTVLAWMLGGHGRVVQHMWSSAHAD